MKSKKLIISIIVVALLIVAGYIYLSRQGKSGEKTFRVGVILPLTGDSAYIGTSIKNGLDIARSEYLEKQTLKAFDLQVDFMDSGGDPTKVVTSYQSLLTLKDCQAIIAVQQGVKTLIPLVDNDKRVLLCTSVPDNGITGQNPWVFRFFINAKTDASTISDYAFKKLGIRRVATIYVNDSMGISYNESFTKSFQGLGGEIVFQESFNPAEADYRTQVLKIKQAAPDGVYLIGYGKSMSNIPIQMREAGITATLLSVGTISQPEIMEAAGEAIEGTYYTTAKFFTFAPDTPELSKFVEDYKSRFGNVPVFFEVFGYDSLKLLLLAAELGGMNPEGLRQALSEIHNVPMAVGNVTVGSDGDVQFPVVVKRIIGGKWVPVE